jgi:hypothetical protein
MVQGGSSPGLAAETFQHLWILGHIVGEELERDEASKLSVFGLIDDAHAAAAKLLHNPVM